MAQLYTKTKLYLEANSKTWDDTMVSLQNNSDGNGDFIASWSYDGLTQPTADQLASYETAGNTAETLSDVLDKRKTEYKDFGYQLDLLYHDMTAGKLDATGEWAKKIKKVKDDNPKS